MNLFNLLNRQRRWSRETFGDGQRTEGILRHIEKELDEVRSKPNDLREWADIVILALEGALRRGFTPFDICRALEKKQAENMARVWNVGPEDEPVEHVRDATDGWEYDLSKAEEQKEHMEEKHYMVAYVYHGCRRIAPKCFVNSYGVWYEIGPYDIVEVKQPYAFAPLPEPPPLPGEEVEE